MMVMVVISRIEMVNLHQLDLWRNGSASDSRSEGCVFDSRQVHIFANISFRSIH